MKNNSPKTSLQSLNRSQMKTLKGGGFPAQDDFCCGISRSQEFWLGQFPILENYYNCNGFDCSQFE